MATAAQHNDVKQLLAMCNTEIIVFLSQMRTVKLLRFYRSVSTVYRDELKPLTRSLQEINNVDLEYLARLSWLFEIVLERLQEIDLATFSQEQLTMIFKQSTLTLLESLLNLNMSFRRADFSTKAASLLEDKRGDWMKFCDAALKTRQARLDAFATMGLTFNRRNKSRI